MEFHNDDPYFRLFTVTAIALIVLMAVGCFIPGGLLWGISFTGFLPPLVTALLVCSAIGLLALLHRMRDGKSLTAICGYLDQHPVIPLAISLATFISLAILLRVRASLLGDSYTLIYNFLDYQNGVSILAPWHEPLSIYVLYYLVHAIGPLQFPEIYSSFSIVEIVFGCGFILTSWYIIRLLFSSPEERILTFLLLISLPYMEFFIGYIEIYSVSTLLLAVYILASLLVLRRKLTFALLPSLYLLMTLSHYISGLLCFALLYNLYLDYGEHRWRRIFPGIISAGILGSIILFLARFDMTRLIDISPISHFLSLTTNITSINSYSQAYTIFSPYHAIDIANYLVFMSPFAVVFFIHRAIRSRIHITWDDATGVWLMIATVPLFLFMCIAKIEQGFASDWDVLAAYFLLLNLFFAYRFFQATGRQGQKTFLLIVLVSIMYTAPWYFLNATREPSIRRFQSLWDNRILSHLGHFTQTIRLTRYYAAEGQPEQNIAVWQHYRHLFPNDPRGYENQIAVLTAYAPESLAQRDAVYAAWRSIDPGNRKLRQEYGGVILTEGNSALGKNDTATALYYYKKAITIDPDQSRAYNNIGSVLAQSGDIPASIPLFERAIAVDSLYSEAMYNLGIALESTGEKDRAARMIARSAALGNHTAQEYIGSVKGHSPHR